MDVPFSKGDLLRGKHDPAKMGHYTGKCVGTDKDVMLQVKYLDGKVAWLPLAALELVKDESLDLRLIQGPYGRADDLRRVITYEKLKGTLHDVIYSMFASKIEFHPHQYKPALKMTRPPHRLILADEVGLGKTIESALVWVELQARLQARRLLVVCPKTLAGKWENELFEKFDIRAQCVDFQSFRKEVHKALQQPQCEFALIATYSGLKPPKEECDLMNMPWGEGERGSEKTEFFRRLREDTQTNAVFDLLVFDEAHYMRNASTVTYKLGKLLAACSHAVLCVSATPINNTSKDLHSLLQFVCEDLGSQTSFERRLRENVCTVRAGNILARSPLDMNALISSVQQMGEVPSIANEKMYKTLTSAINALDRDDKMQVARCQRMVEMLNLLGSYVNRTRHVQVHADRPVREPTVLALQFSDMERRLYDAILRLVRERCKREESQFHRFRVLGLQLKAASCLPVLAREIRANHLLDTEGALCEALGMDEDANQSAQKYCAPQLPSEVLSLADYNFETNDSKYSALRRMLTEQIPKEKVVIFAHYIATLEYLKNRLEQDGIPPAVIHGGTSSDERWREIENFSEPKGPRVLLSSEVGSEGIDLQFCHVIVNYDVPWNPMRLEQRIGRIDRIGQKSRKLTIVNFKVAGTVEERLYECLHEKLAIFERSLGDMEDILGREIRQLTLDVLSEDLSPEQERARMEKAQAALAHQILLVQQLDEAKDTFMGLSDVLQNQIEEARGKGRYVQPAELERYLEDFFRREFRGCEVLPNTPLRHCYKVTLTPEAVGDLNHFIKITCPAHALYDREVSLCFRNECVYSMSRADKKRVRYESHLSPLVRWITNKNRESSETLYNVSALRVPLRTPLPAPGAYCYFIERWTLKGLTVKARLSYAVGSLSSDWICEGDVAEEILQHAISKGEDWDYAGSNINRARISNMLTAIMNRMDNCFEEALEDFVSENEVEINKRKQNIISSFDIEINAAASALQTTKEGGADPKIIGLNEARLEKAEKNKAARLAELDKKAERDMERAEVAAGIFLVE